MRRTRKFLALPRWEQAAFIEAWTWLGVKRLEIFRRSFRDLTSDLHPRSGALQAAPVDDDELERALAVGRAVGRAARFTPWDSTCLVQVLAAQVMLKRRGIPGAFYLGTASESVGDDIQLSAHAWLKCGERTITGEAGRDKFTVVSTFTWV